MGFPCGSGRSRTGQSAVRASCGRKKKRERVNIVKKNLKRVFSLLMAFVMIFSMTVLAYADDAGTVDAGDVDTAAETDAGAGNAGAGNAGAGNAGAGNAGAGDAGAGDAGTGDAGAGDAGAGDAGVPEGEQEGLEQQAPSEESGIPQEQSLPEEENAAGEAVAKIGEETYTTLTEAVSEAQAGETITLLKNVSLDAALTIKAEKDIVLDLGGFTLDVTPSTGNFSLINYGTLHLKNGTVTKSNKYGIYNEGTAEITGVTISTYDFAIYNQAGSCTVSDSQITVTAEEEVFPYGVYLGGNSRFAMTNSKVSSAFTGIYTPQNESPAAQITGSEIYGGVRAMIQWGSGTVTLDSTKLVSDNNNVLEANYGRIILQNGCSLWNGDQLGVIMLGDDAVVSPDTTTQYKATWEEYAGTKYGENNPIPETEYRDDTENKTVHIYSADGLAWWAYQVNTRAKSFAGYTVLLETAAIDLSAHVWEPVNGNYLDGFTLQGQAGGTAIQNMLVSSGTANGYYSGFIGDIGGSSPVTISNLRFENANVDFGRNIVAIVLGRANNSDVTLENIQITNSRVYGYGKVAPLVGQANARSLTINNCTVDAGTTVEGAYNCGGLVGLRMNNCTELSISGSSSEAKWEKSKTDTYVCYTGTADYLNDGDVLLNPPVDATGIYCVFAFKNEYMGYYAAWGDLYTDYMQYYNLDESLSDYANTLLFVGLCHDAQPHTGFTDWELSKEPTATEPGEETGYCNVGVCDETATRYFWNVTLDPNDGGSESVVVPVYFMSGEDALLSRPEDPVREGYIFDGWYAGDAAFDFSAPVTGHMTLAAHWQKIIPNVTVRYELNGGSGSGYEAQTVKQGETFTVKAAPDREGYTFTGWSDGSKVYQPGDVVAAEGDITLTAQWKENVKPAQTDAPKTGDESNLGLWIGLLAFSAVVILTAAVYLVMKNRKKNSGSVD